MPLKMQSDDPADWKKHEAADGQFIKNGIK